MAGFTLAQIAEQIGGQVYGPADLRITGTAEIDRAGQGDITFLANPRYKHHLETTKAAAIIVDDKIGDVPEIPYIKVADAYFAFLQTVRMFHPPRELLAPGIHPTAVIHESAVLEDGVRVGAHVFIGRNVHIGRNTQIFPNCVILDNVSIGEGCILYPSVSIREDCQIGHRVILHNGVVVGSDGFGFAYHEGQYVKIPQVGRVIIEDQVEIGANATIDRATLGETVIKTGVKLDNLVHIAHNVVVGEHTVIAAQTGISGSTRIGKQVMMGGQVGTVGHITIGDGAQIGAQSGVSKSVPAGEVVFGYPARPIMKTKRIEAALNQLPDLLKRVRQLEQMFERLQNPLKKD